MTLANPDAAGAGADVLLAAFPLVSVVIPARNEESRIGEVVRLVRAQALAGGEVEVIVVDDASDDLTAACAEAAGARVIRLPARAGGGNPAAARNRGAAETRGDPIIFLDSDCTPRPGWLAALLRVLAAGYAVVGGSLGLPPGLSVSARCDYYCGWYHVHPRRCAGEVSHHPPCNIGVRRAAFFATSGYVERQPIAYAHEELAWQAAILARGERIFFEPRAVVDHHNRPGFGNLLRRNYRWGYSAIPAKATTGTARFASLYRHPRLLIAASLPLGVVSAGYIVGCWLKARVFEPLWMVPALLTARIAYAAGMAAGGWRWLDEAADCSGEHRPRWE